MSEVVVDLLPGDKVRKTASGYEYDRTAMVYGLTGDSHERGINAVLAVIAEVGDIGEEHPRDPTIRISEFETDPEASDVIRVTIQYRRTGGAGFLDVTQWEVGSAITQVESNKDADGNVIQVAYTYPMTYVLDPAKRGKTVQQGGLVGIPSPESTLIGRRREMASPGPKSRLFSGKTNLPGWDIDPLAPARRWLCTGIVGTSPDGGLTWDVQYSFQYREDGWDETVVFINPDTGRPPEDLVLNVGSKLVKKTKSLDFNELNL